MWFLFLFQERIRCNMFCYDYTGTCALSRRKTIPLITCVPDRGEHTCRCIHKCLRLCCLGFAGYGINAGEPTSNDTLADIDAAYAQLIELGFAPSNIILYGRSGRFEHNTQAFASASSMTPTRYHNQRHSQWGVGRLVTWQPGGRSGDSSCIPHSFRACRCCMPLAAAISVCLSQLPFVYASRSCH